MSDDPTMARLEDQDRVFLHRRSMKDQRRYKGSQGHRDHTRGVDPATFRESGRSCCQMEKFPTGLFGILGGWWL